MTIPAIKDPTAALRVRRHRAKKKMNGTTGLVTVRPRAVVTVTTPEMCALAARIGDGRANPGDLQLAERLIMALVDWLPPDSILKL